VILSGAGVREAEAGLLQLSQGLASNTLQGDELRSVLENLPYVADVIAKHFGITRGELRKFGREGKISAKDILEAFKKAGTEIDQNFLKTVPTIGQSFEVLKTKLLETLKRLNDLTGASSGVAKAIIGIAESLDYLIGGLVTAGAAFAAFKLGQFVSGILSSIAANRALAKAVAEGNAVLLTAVEIEKAKAATALQDAQATLASAAADRTAAAAAVAQLEAQRALLITQQGSIKLDAQRKIARDALTGRFIAYDAALAQNVRTNIALTRTETALAAARTELSAATVAQTGAETALTAAQGRAATATAAASGFTAKLARAFPGLTALVGVATGAFEGLWAVIVANPIVAIIAAIVAVIAALVLFSDKIAITSDGVVTLRDVFIASFQLIMEAIAPVTDFLGTAFSEAFKYVSGLWNKFTEFVGNVLNAILQGIKSYINLQIGLWVGLVNSIIRAWGLLPGAIADLGRMAMNGLITIVEEGIRGVLKAIQGLLSFIGSAAELVGQENPFKNLLDPDALVNSLNLDQYRQKLTGAAQEVGDIFSEEFGKSLNTDYIGNAWSAILERARKIAEQRLADLNKPGTTAPGTGTGTCTDGKNKKTFADFVKELTTENELLKLNSAEREKLQAVLKIEKELKRSLTQDERALILSLLDENEVLKKASEIYEQIKGPAYDYQLALKAINELLKEGRINQDEFNKATLNARITFLDTQTDLASGFERGFLKILQKTGDFAKQAEDIVTNAFDGMSQAIADLVVDGSADFGSLIKTINKQIVQLVVSQAFQQLFGNKGIGGAAGTGGGNIFSSLFSGLKSLFGFANGGSFTVGAGSAVGSLPGQIDNRLVAFRAKDGENVTVTPKGQSASSGQPIQVIFNVQTPDVKGFKESQSQLAAKAARIISQGRRNM